jgi:hypothetical protein
VEQRRQRNPFRSEADAFWLLGIIGAAVASVVLAAALGGAPLGGPFALVLIGLGARATIRWLRSGIAAPSEEDQQREQPEDGEKRP